MSRTKYMTTFENIVSRMVDDEANRRGLAGDFHNNVCMLVKENGGFDSKKIATVWEETVEALTKYAIAIIKEKLGDDTPLSTAVPSFRQYASDYRNGIKAGLDPTKYSSYSLYRNAKADVGKGRAVIKEDGSTSTIALKESNAPPTAIDKLPVMSGGAQVTSVSPFDKLGDELKAKLTAFALKLGELDESDALAIVDKATEKAYDRLRKGNPRFHNLKAGGSNRTTTSH